MSCYCTNSWNPHYDYEMPYYGAYVSRKHCSPSVAGVKLCVERQGAGGVASIEYRGKTLGSATVIWGQPLQMDVGTTVFGKWVGVTLSAMPHTSGCITDIRAQVCLSSHCSGINLPEFCLTS